MIFEFTFFELLHPLSLKPLHSHRHHPVTAQASFRFSNGIGAGKSLFHFVKARNPGLWR
jgi:hypothetical protein